MVEKLNSKGILSNLFHVAKQYKVLSTSFFGNNIALFHRIQRFSSHCRNKTHILLHCTNNWLNEFELYGVNEFRIENFRRFLAEFGWIRKTIYLQFTLLALWKQVCNIIHHITIHHITLQYITLQYITVLFHPTNCSMSNTLRFQKRRIASLSIFSTARKFRQWLCRTTENLGFWNFQRFGTSENISVQFLLHLILYIALLLLSFSF